ncbi:DUF1549 domain-containing protein [Verrucomicrobiota bacterium sgz303538]
MAPFRPTTLLLTALVVLSVRNAEAADLTFERDIRPILKTHCFHCHGEGEELKGGVDLRLKRFLLKPTEDGAHVMVPGKPEESEMVKLIREGEMPKKGRKLTAAELATLEQWISHGAQTLREEPAEVPKFWITEEEREFWAFQPIRHPEPPVVKNPARVRTPVDAFVLAKLETQGLDFAPEADKPTLLRRVTLDLTGLPPTPEEVDAFIGDNTPEAYDKVVDRLLASPAYGERWARHWLDVAGYADSNGFTEADSPRPHAWHYRDYVIRAMNGDKPWDQFIQEQLAGDELADVDRFHLRGALEDPARRDMLAATGFLRMAPDGTGDAVPDQNLARNQVVADTLKVVSSSLLGLTVGCAQCHDHRYDPIAHADYFRLRAIFAPAYDWKKWLRPSERLVSLYTPEERAKAEAIESEAKKIDEDSKAMNAKFKDEIFDKRLAEVPEELREKIREARKTAADKRTEEQKQLFKEYPGLNVDAGSLDLFDREADKKVKARKAEADKLRGTKPTEQFLMALTETVGEVPDTFLFHRGDHEQPREKIEPGELAVLNLADSATIPTKDAALHTTGRRLAYARHLTDGKHPLVARVLVNRFWMHHFGRGIVNTPGDFGVQGERPTHPELLDWLASEFMTGGWRLKPLHKLLVTSTAYRQSTRHDASLREDPENKLYGRFKLNRLDSETLRDVMLTVCGKLNPEPFGEPVPVAVDLSGRVVVGQQKKDGNGDPTGVDGVGDKEFRRSIYAQVRRKFPLTVLDAFDAPVMSPNCDARASTTVAPQSLLLMNDSFVVNTATHFAERLRREHTGDARAQITRAWQLLFGVGPSESEQRDMLLYLAEQGETLRARIAAQPPKKDAPAPDPQLQALASLCQALLSTNRFLYVE